MLALRAGILAIGIAGFLDGCGSVHMPLRPIDPAAYDTDKDAFLAELVRIAGTDATNCGFFQPLVNDNSQANACVRDAWANHRAFTVANEYREGYCPNLVGYAADGNGRVYLVQSCPDRDHVDAQTLHPSVNLCPDYEPPDTRNGGGQCSILDGI